MKRVISFSLWGDSPKYIVGFLKNLDLAARYYPGWAVRVYIDHKVPPFHRGIGIVAPKDQQIEVVVMSPGMPFYEHPMMWRFLVADDPTVDRFIVRDADSRIGPREADAVDRWICEDTILHVMRSHPAHCQAIMGGMFGLQPRRNNWEMPSMAGLIKEYLSDGNRSYRPGEYMEDQDMLARKIWPWARRSVTQHASVCRNAYGAKPFPTYYNDWPRFIGEVWEIDPVTGIETPRERDWESVPKEDHLYGNNNALM